MKKQWLGVSIYKYFQQVQGYLAPPITAVFLLGLFWKKPSNWGLCWINQWFHFRILKLLIEAIVSFNETRYG